MCRAISVFQGFVITFHAFFLISETARCNDGAFEADESDCDEIEGGAKLVIVTVRSLSLALSLSLLLSLSLSLSLS